jgi:hypothetical protein
MAGRPTKEEINAKKAQSKGATNPNFNQQVEDDLIIDSVIEEQVIVEDEILDPLVSEQVIERDYTKLDAQVIGHIDSVAEPIIDKQVIDLNATIIDDNRELYPPSEPTKEPEPKEEPGKVTNPGWEDLTSKQKNASSEYLAETCINAYVMLNELGKKWCSFDEAKMQSQALDGKFDFGILALVIPLSEDGSESITIGEFFDSVNKQAEEVFVVSQEFKDSVKPILIEIFKKKGWGLTPEQRLIALIVEDATPKVMVAFSIRSQFKQLIKIGMSMLNNQKVEQQQRYSAAQEQANMEAQRQREKEQEVIIPEVVVDGKEEFQEPA